MTAAPSSDLEIRPHIRLEELARYIHAELIGSGDVLISGVSNFEHATSKDLVYLAGDRFLQSAKASQAGAFLLSKPSEELQRPQLIYPHPQIAFIKLIQQFFQSPPVRKGVSRHASIGTDVQVGPDPTIGPYVCIGDRVTIGARVTLHAGVVIGNDVTIGDDALLYPNVSILDGASLGCRVVVHSGTVIGSDGFGYVQHEGRHHKIPQLGNVIIEDDVELGANVTVDRATFGHTLVKKGTKIDNQVQIAHNVTVGEHSILVAQVGIAGSTTIGQYVMIGGQAGLVDHITIGDRAMIAAGSGVSHPVEPGKAVSGRPAMDHATWLKAQVMMKKLPELRHHILELEKRIKKLEATSSRSKKTRAPKTS